MAYIAQGMYKFSTTSETKVDALMQLCTFSVFTIDNTIKVTITFEGYNPSIYSYSTEFTHYEALKDALLSNYRQFNIKLYQEI